MVLRASLALTVLLQVAVACDHPDGEPRPAPPPHHGIYGFAGGCYAMDASDPGATEARWLVASPDGAKFSFSGRALDAGARFRVRASDLGTYLFYDEQGRYLVAGDGVLRREDKLLSDILLLDDLYRSPAEWELQVSAQDPDRLELRSYGLGGYLTTRGLTTARADAAVIALYPVEGCAAFPEMTLDADGEADPRTWEDGAVFGIVDTHSHLFTNFGFGGGGMFHGAPFHRLGVEHALGSCEPYHGVDGRRDIIGYAFSGLGGPVEVGSLLTILLTATLPSFNHHTDGYPTFTDWPNAWQSATHQTQYYRWIERAHLGGLRLLVQHATTNSVLCELMSGIQAQGTRYACDDMVAVDREIAETYALERYIDAQSGGPGMGWLRVVKSPAEARQVINEGRLAVVLGIETSNLFDCFLTPRAGHPACDEAYVRAQLDRYQGLGVRAIFPVHKLDNAFSPGDGDRNVGQIGSFINSGHWSSFVTDCPDVSTVFDAGPVTFGGLNRPRDTYLAPAPNDLSGFAVDPLGTLLPFVAAVSEPPQPGDHCQSASFTPLGETLLREMMLRGMIVEIDHLPRRSYLRAAELLAAADYPAVGSHGNTNGGRIYDHGGVSKIHLGRCGHPDVPGIMAYQLREHTKLSLEHGGYPGVGFGFDLNGFAGGPRPRFGDQSPCTTPQASPITYPFTSYRGDVRFDAPRLGERSVDFNTEGMLHLGLLPELIEDARRTGVTDEELEPLFRSAEAYLRMWERAEERAAALRRGPS